MKFGVLADIHGDIDALEKCLYILERQNVDTIVCAGDIVGKGPYPLPVMEWFEQLKIPCIVGNHERFRLEGDTQDALILPYIGQLPSTICSQTACIRVKSGHCDAWTYAFAFISSDRQSSCL